MIPETRRNTAALALLTLSAALFIPASNAIANDTDLFRRAIPPNILFFVDNSSSMRNVVTHRDYEGSHKVPDGSGGFTTVSNKNQTECRWFRDNTGSIRVYDTPTLQNYTNVNGIQAFYRKNTQAHELDFPINDMDGNHLFLDLNRDGVQQEADGEIWLYHRMLNPETTNQTNWDTKNGIGTGREVPIQDYDGTHLFYDDDGDGNYEPADGDRLLYYELKNGGSSNNPKGSKAKSLSYISDASALRSVGMDPLTLRFAPGSTICGVDASNYSLWDKDDPFASAIDGTSTTQFKPEYLDFLFSSYGATARRETFDVERDYTLANSSGIGINDGKREKAGCLTLGTVGGAPEPRYYWTYRRTRIQALKLILRQLICRVNEQTDTGVRFGYAQFRYHGKSGDDNGAYVAVPVMDWYRDKALGSPMTYTLHGETLTHEEHLLKAIDNSTPDAQTPLNEGLFQLYTYFMPRTAADMPYGRDIEGSQRDGVELAGATHKFPVYNYDMSLYDPKRDTMYNAANTPPSSLYEVGGVFMGSDPGDYDEDAAIPAAGSTVFDGFAAPDPIQYACQKSFILIITDGGSAGDDFTDRDEDIYDIFGADNNLPVDFDTGTDRGYDIFYELIGDHFRMPDPDNPGSTLPDEGRDEAPASGSMNLLDDIALFMNRYDYRPDLPGVQVIDTYTVGYSMETQQDPDAEEGDELDPNSLNYGSALERAAKRGNGLYFESSDADQLEDDLVSAIADMIDKAQAFTSATVPASRTTDGNHFYSSYFLPKEDTGLWEGHLKSFEFTALGDILDKNGYCATGASGNVVPNPTCQAGGQFDLFAEGYWDAADEVPAPLSRNLLVEANSPTPFTKPASWDSTEMDEFDLEIVDGGGTLLSLVQAAEPYASSTAIGSGPGALADAIVEHISGCEFDSSPCTPRLNEEQTHKVYLGDIFHSNPVVVGSPNSAINSASYRDFALDKRQRPRVIYAGANDGFLHGFHAGTWRTTYVDDAGSTQTLPIPRHDAGTGEEIMGYMPYEVRQKIWELPTQTSFPRTLESVDAPPVAADVWFYRSVSGGLPRGGLLPAATYVDQVKQQWRTIIMGGLRNGGRMLYALDITEPQESAAAAKASAAYPLTLWSFPCEGNATACTGAGSVPGGLTYQDYMGLTWSEPIITRVKVAVNGGSPQGHERWVAIVGAGYDPESDPNLKSNAGEPDYDPAAKAGRAILMIDITTGKLLAAKFFDPNNTSINGTQIGFEQMLYAFASAPAVYDLDFDGYADVIYIPDLGGNIWKWVISDIGHDPINNTPGSDNANPAQPNWPFRLFFAAQPDKPALERSGGSYDKTVHYQSFFFPPTGTIASGVLHLAIGAGERANPKGPDSHYGDNDPSNNNRYYVIKDRDPLENEGATYLPIADQMRDGDLNDLDSNFPADCTTLKASGEGYFFRGFDAEKFITNSVIFLGQVISGSYVPPDPYAPGGACESSGTGYVFSFDIECGNPTFGGGTGVPANDRRREVGGGIPTRPRISVGDLNQGGSNSGDCRNKVVMITSDGSITNDCPGSIDNAGVRIKSWRQR